MNIKEAYALGFEHGLDTFAYMQDGEVYVGTCGRKLKDAVKQKETLWNYNPPTNISKEDQLYDLLEGYYGVYEGVYDMALPRYHQSEKAIAIEEEVRAILDKSNETK